MSFFESPGLEMLMESTLIDLLGRRPEVLVTYKELADECSLAGNLPMVDLGDASQRTLFSELLGRVADSSYQSLGFVITSVVVLSSGEGAGLGLKTALIRNGLLRKSASEDAYELVRFAEMRKAWEKFSPRR